MDLLSRRFFFVRLFSYFGVGSSSPPAPRCCVFFFLVAGSVRLVRIVVSGGGLTAGFWLSQSGSDRQCAWWSTTHGCSFFLSFFFLMIRVGPSWTWNSSGISCPQTRRSNADRLPSRIFCCGSSLETRKRSASAGTLLFL